MKTIQIEVTRGTIIKLEEAIEKYNRENRYSIDEYDDIIFRLLRDYLKTKK